jgi:Zn-dependent peptidase ImmA (M78 family)
MADTFSANLLMPRQGILEMIPDNELEKDKLSLRTILYLENYLKVSRQALLYRLKGMGLLSEDKFSQFNRDIVKSAREYGYGEELYKPGNSGKVIGDYGAKAKLLFDKDKISESHYYELMQSIDFGQSTEE